MREIWLSSEDTGAYGRDIGTDLPALLRSLTAVLPADGSVMLRVGMTNPPFILEHLDAMAAALNHPAVFSYLHVPVQSGTGHTLYVRLASLRGCGGAHRVHPRWFIQYPCIVRLVGQHKKIQVDGFFPHQGAMQYWTPCGENILLMGSERWLTTCLPTSPAWSWQRTSSVDSQGSRRRTTGPRWTC